MVAFEIPYPRDKAAWNKRFGLNAYYAGKDYHVRARDAKDLHALTLAYMHKARIPRKLVKGPVEVRFLWDDGLDIDNHAAIGKAMVDAMKGYLLPNDNRKWFVRVVHEFWRGGVIRVEVREVENDDF